MLVPRQTAAALAFVDESHWLLLAGTLATAVVLIGFLFARYRAAIRLLRSTTAALHEEQLRLGAAAEKLAASEEQFRLLAENSSDVIMRIDWDGVVLWASPSVTSVLGWLPDDCVGHKGDDLFASNAGRLQFRRELQAAFAGRTIVLRTQLLTKAGEARWVEIHAGPYRAANGRIDSIVASFRTVEAEVAAERILELRASTDELTKLLNREEAFGRIDRLDTRAGLKTAVLLCDIDHFKLVNDNHGHAAGDAVLEALAERIRGCLRSTDDMGARIGGDEVLILLSGVHDLQNAAAIAENLRCRAAEPMTTPVGPVGITVSIGVTLVRPGEAADAVVARADAAMYEAKRRGRNQVVVLAEAAAGDREDRAASA